MPYLNSKNRNYITAAFSAALLILAAIFYVTYRTNKQREIITNWLIHTHEVLTESERLYSLVKDAQRSQRGYLLTQDRVYLERYRLYKNMIDEDLQDLQQLTGDQPQQQMKLYKLKKLSEKSLTYWDQTIALFHQKGIEASLALVKSGLGREIVDEFGMVIDEFKEFEQALLEKRQQEFDNSRRLFRLMETMGAIASLALLTISFLLLRSRLEREEQLSRTLEDMVQQRTEELQASNEELQKSLQDVSVMNQELQRTNADLDNFVYTASHDLRSPIINLESLLKLLSTKLQGKISAKEDEILGRMTESTARLSRTIKDLSEVARIQKEEQHRDLLSFDEIYKEVEQEILLLQPIPDLIIEKNFSVAQVQFANSHLRSILYNLLSNAVKYRSPNRPVHIKISTWEEDGKIFLAVSDNGLGLEPDQINKLFLMFKRLHTHVEGTGIGLYMIKRIVENNGGKIEAESQKDVGTTFKVIF